MDGCIILIFHEDSKMWDVGLNLSNDDTLKFSGCPSSGAAETPVKFQTVMIILTYYGLVTPYDKIDLEKTLAQVMACC